jgi:acylpyruvate hydrolase
MPTQHNSHRANWQFTDSSAYDGLPVGTLYCIGRNYRNHAAEMNAPIPETPLVFLKPPSAYLPTNSMVVLPMFTANVHYEVEMVVVIGAVEPMVTIAGIGVGIDFTARDVQQRAKERGEPWATAKSWKHSAPVSPLLDVAMVDATNCTLWLQKNGAVVQSGNTNTMERSVQELVVYLHSIFALQPGDAVFTGTPAGVGPVQTGDTLSATLEGSSVQTHLQVTIV